MPHLSYRRVQGLWPCLVPMINFGVIGLLLYLLGSGWTERLLRWWGVFFVNSWTGLLDWLISDAFYIANVPYRPWCKPAWPVHPIICEGPVHTQELQQGFGPGRYDNQFLIPSTIPVHAELENRIHKFIDTVYALTPQFQRSRIRGIC